MIKLLRSRGTMIAAVAGSAFFAFHVCCTLIYSVPELPVPETARALTSRYMVPWFHQGWKLFAPDVPNDQYLLEYRIPQSVVWSEWRNAETMESISSHPRIPYIAQKLQLYLANDMRKNLFYNEDSTLNYSLIIDDVPYMRVLYYAVRRHEILNGERPDSLQLRMTVQFTPAMDDLNLPEDRVFIFPVYHMP